MLRPLPARADPVVVELGRGTASVTKPALQRRLRGRGRHLAVEIDPVLAARLARRFPAVDIACADAAELPRLCRDRGIEQIDLVVSLLPWRAHRGAPIPDLVAEMLAPDGAFTQVVLAALRLDGTGASFGPRYPRLLQRRPAQPAGPAQPSPGPGTHRARSKRAYAVLR